jgi:hypothetical protein
VCLSSCYCRKFASYQYVFDPPTSRKINMHEEVAQKTVCDSIVQVASLVY